MRRFTGAVSQYVPASRHLYMETETDRRDTYVYVRQGLCASDPALCKICRASTSAEKKGTALLHTEDVEKLDILFWFPLFSGSSFFLILLFLSLIHISEPTRP